MDRKLIMILEDGINKINTFGQEGIEDLDEIIESLFDHLVME